MARQSLVLDASVGVKWFSSKDEASLVQALAIRDAHIEGHALIVVPDLFFYEVANAIAQKQAIPPEAVQSAVASMFALGITAVSIDPDLLDASVTLSRQIRITVYDSIYIAVAMKHDCPLVTANPHHQKQGGLNCKVVPVEEWRPER
ncbi:MAG: type II toxin-antitoxin system VapC family toxin [Dehalococcoidia bacterium]|nr:type II toxin-antitoxin system VapC family toxin [Dehalococcoidia bacterium]